MQATLSDGSTVRLGRAPLEWARVRSLEITSERSGYRVTPLSASGTVRLVTTAPQPSDPNPGPSAEVSLAPASRCSVAARITVR